MGTKPDQANPGASSSAGSVRSNTDVPDWLQQHECVHVALGASNLARGASSLWTWSRERARGPRALLGAWGRGRSFGMNTSFLGRGLPSILDAELWPMLEAQRPKLLRAVVTDAGNDLLFGVSPEQLLDWVAEAVRRLQALDGRVVMTGLPLQRLERLGPKTFRFWKSLFFPGRKLDYESMRSAIARLDTGLRELAEKTGSHWVQPELEWYGADPIHIRGGQIPRAWGSITEAWGKQPSSTLPDLAQPDEEGAEVSGSGQNRRQGRAAWLERARLAKARSHGQSFLGRPWSLAQPVLRDPDGSALGLY